MEAGDLEGGKAVSGDAVVTVTLGGRSPQLLDECSLDRLIERKIARFLSQLGEHPPANLHALFMGKFEKAFLTQVMRYTGDSRVSASRILGISRNTLSKRLRAYEIS